MWGLKKLAISESPSRAHSLASWPTAGGGGSEIDDRRRDVLPLAVGDDLRPPVAIAMRHDRVGGAQVDADEGGHIRTSIVLAATPCPGHDRLANPSPERLGPLSVGTELALADEGSDLCHRQEW